MKSKMGSKEAGRVMADHRNHFMPLAGLIA